MVFEGALSSSEANLDRSASAAEKNGGPGGGGGLDDCCEVGWHHPLGGRMPYIFVRENAIKYWCTVQGLSHNEVRVLAEKVQDQPEHQVEHKAFP